MLLISEKQYLQMKNLINDLCVALERVSSTIDRNSIKFVKDKWEAGVENMEALYREIAEEFNDGKINKKSYELQI